MLVSEYIASFLYSKGIKDVFGYPGGMVTYLMEAFDRHPHLTAHLCYHEQGAAFAACGYAMTKGIPGVAYATSGPGATNLLTGVADAYFDSIPALFITGQVNTYDLKNSGVRQHGFQETDIVSMVESVTKAAVQVRSPERIGEVLQRLYDIAMSDRKGPVLLDIPMNVQRSEWDGIEPAAETRCASSAAARRVAKEIRAALDRAERPLLLLGAGVKQSDSVAEVRRLVSRLGVPAVTSMIAVDVLPHDNPYNLGFIGAYGHRWANFATEKADLIIALGSRMDARQTGSRLDWFAPRAEVYRVDVDQQELERLVKDDEHALHADLRAVLSALLDGCLDGYDKTRWQSWNDVCAEMRSRLDGMDETPENAMVRELSRMVPEDAIVTTDVGQNQVWVSQSFEVKRQTILYSGGHGAMGFSLPAAVGACIASGRRPVYAFCGDGGLQMNIQELETIRRERLPIKILLLNNHSLGMIRHFQEMYFQSNFVQTKPEHGYTVPDFVKIAEAYGIPAGTVASIEDISDQLTSDGPAFLDILCRNDTYIYPKLAIHKPIYDQDPLMDRELLMKLKQL